MTPALSRRSRSRPRFFRLRTPGRFAHFRLIELVDDVERAYYGMSAQRHARVGLLEVLDEVTRTGNPLHLDPSLDEHETLSAQALFSSQYRDLALRLDSEARERAIDAWLKVATAQPSKWEILAGLLAAAWEKPLKGAELARAAASLKRDWQKWNAGLGDRWMHMRMLSADDERDA